MPVGCEDLDATHGSCERLCCSAESQHGAIQVCIWFCMSRHVFVGSAQPDVFHVESQPHYIVRNAELPVPDRYAHAFGAADCAQSAALCPGDIPAAVSFPQWTDICPDTTSADLAVLPLHREAELRTDVPFVDRMSADMPSSAHERRMDDSNPLPPRGSWSVRVCCPFCYEGSRGPI